MGILIRHSEDSSTESPRVRSRHTPGETGFVSIFELADDIRELSGAELKYFFESFFLRSSLSTRRATIQCMWNTLDDLEKDLFDFPLVNNDSTSPVSSQSSDRSRSASSSPNQNRRRWFARADEDLLKILELSAWYEPYSTDNGNGDVSSFDFPVTWTHPGRFRRANRPTSAFGRLRQLDDDWSSDPGSSERPFSRRYTNWWDWDNAEATEVEYGTLNEDNAPANGRRQRNQAESQQFPVSSSVNPGLSSITLMSPGQIGTDLVNLETSNRARRNLQLTDNSVNHFDSMEE
ncbi:hypothetical protein HK098_003695 [Nowakowskiella sp. JEL0407]|nr:hypothetical protein HK098_003695 [Nowakowskiella sp. JEL0407]